MLMLLDEEALELVSRNCTFRGGRCVHSEGEAANDCAAARHAESKGCAAGRRMAIPREDHSPAEWLEDWY